MDTEREQGTVHPDVKTRHPNRVPRLRGSCWSRGQCRPWCNLAVTVHEKVAGVASRFPSASIAVTVSVWTPLRSWENVADAVQGAGSPPSRLHWNVACSLAENENA